MTNDTLLLRQINPSWIQLDHVSSQAFKPTLKDKRRLSVYNGDQVTAEDSWIHYTEKTECSSAGVMAVSVEECQLVSLRAEPDPEPFPAHAVIKFDGCSNSQIEKKAKHLKKAAEVRGWQYQAEAEA